MAEVKTSDVTIVHFGVGQGDCTLIVVKDTDQKGELHTIATLIDTGPAEILGSVSHRQVSHLWREIWKRITDEYGETNKHNARLDYFVVSHLEGDHMGLATELLVHLHEARKKENSYDWLNEMRIIDRLAFRGTSPNNYRRWKLKSAGKKKRSASKQYLERIYHYERYIYENYKRSDLRPELMVGDDLFSRFQFSDLKLKNAQMVCIASNGVIGTMRRAEYYYSELDRPRSENDLSFAFLLRFGSFLYYTGSDLGGRTLDDSKGNRQSNMEAPLAKHLEQRWKALHGPKPFHTCALKANHHGSRYSTSGRFIQWFKPDIVVFSAAGPVEGVGVFPMAATIARLIPDSSSAEGEGLPMPPPRRILLCTFSLSKARRPENRPNNHSPFSLSPYEHELRNFKMRSIVIQDVILRVNVGKGNDGFVLGDAAPLISMYRLERDVYTMNPLNDSDPTDLPYRPFQIDRTKHENLVLPKFGTEATP